MSLRGVLVAVTFCVLVSLFPVHGWCLSASDQNFYLDSLKNVLESHPDDDIKKLDALTELGWETRRQSPSRALEYTKQALSLAEELGCDERVARILANMGHIYWRLGDFGMSYDFLFEGMHMFENLGDREQYARTLNHMGILFHARGHFDTALEYYFMSLDEYGELDLVAETAKVLNNIGLVYQQQKDLENAEEYHMRSLAIKHEYDNQRGKAYSYSNLGSVSREKGNYEQALAYNEAALEIWEKFPDKREAAYTRRNIGNIYHSMGRLEAAAEELEQTRDAYIEVDDKKGLAQVYNELGKVYLDMGDLERSRLNLEEALALTEIIEITPFTVEIFHSMSRLMYKLGSFRQAYELQERYVAIKDSIDSEESRRRSSEMRQLYERRSRELDIELLRRANQVSELNLEKQKIYRNFLLVLIILIAIMLLVIYYRFREVRQTNRLLEIQKDEISKSNARLQELNQRLTEQKQKVEQINLKLKKSEKELIAANLTKDKFFSIISHDLRNPFASIVSFSRILKRDISNLSSQELVELAEELDKSVIKINNLLENLLQWSRTQTGKITFNPARFMLSEVVADSLKLFSSNAREKGVELIDRTRNGLYVYGDANMTRTIIRNLLSNAIKYSERGDMVVISAEKLDKMVRVSIADEGVGISKENQKKLFSIDSLYSTFGTNDEKGSGLGLLLCSEFVRIQGGDLELKSKEGEGTVISFTIPAGDPGK